MDPRHAVEGRDGGGARLVDRRTEAHRERGGDDPPRVADRPVDDHRCRQLAVRDEDAARVVGDERRVEEVHLLDEARLVADGDAVADPERLREGDEHPRAEVRERRVEGEAGEQTRARRSTRAARSRAGRCSGTGRGRSRSRSPRRARPRPCAGSGASSCAALRVPDPSPTAAARTGRSRSRAAMRTREHDGEADAGRDQRLDGAIAHARPVRRRARRSLRTLRSSARARARPRGRRRRGARGRPRGSGRGAIMQEILIGEVEIISRLISRSASVRNIVAATPGCERMPAPMSDTLPSSLVLLDREGAELVLGRRERALRRRDVLGGHRERHLRPPVDDVLDDRVDVDLRPGDTRRRSSPRRRAGRGCRSA